MSIVDLLHLALVLAVAAIDGWFLVQLRAIHGSPEDTAP